MTAIRNALGCATVFLLSTTPAEGEQVERVAAEPANLAAIPVSVHGRVENSGRHIFRRQWPGTYFETAFRGPSAMFRVGPGKVSLRIRVDGHAPMQLVTPATGLYRIGGLGPGPHRVRIDVANENQDSPSDFGGFYGSASVQALPVPHRSKAIEFIGDSHTVGYGNTSLKRECTDEEVWSTTDTSQGIAPRLAARYQADYQVNAISGRGVVRNYNGFAADPLPAAYPYVLFDGKQAYSDPLWHPQLLVIALGTNDFSTPLHDGEKWKTRADLSSDFEESYVRFVRNLRARNPRAYILLWIADNGDDEIVNEVRKVAVRVQAAGETRIGFVPVSGLALTGCNYHPNLADDETIARTLARFIDSQPTVWR